MALRIRLARGGAKKRPYYRIVVADSRMPRDGRYIEKIGSYDPMLGKEDPNRVQLVEDLPKAKAQELMREAEEAASAAKEAAAAAAAEAAEAAAAPAEEAPAEVSEDTAEEAKAE